MTDREYRDARRAFINGEIDRLRLGGYGGTITVRIVTDGVRISTTKPTRRQMTLTPNSRAIRESAVQAAEATLDRLRGLPSRRRVRVSPPRRGKAGIITPREVWVAYLRLRLGAIPEDEVLDWGRKDVVAFLRRLPPSVRRAALEPARPSHPTWDGS